MAGMSWSGRLVFPTSSSILVRERCGRLTFIPVPRLSQNGLRTSNLQRATERSHTMNREQIEQEVARLADAWATAELQGNTAFLERTLADDFVGIGPLGFLLTKQEWFARHQTGDLKYTVHALDEVKVRVYNE